MSRDIRLGEGYVEPGVDAFARMLTTGALPIPREQLIVPILVLERTQQLVAGSVS